MKYFFISMRPKQWIKNLLIILPPLFSFDFNIIIFIFSLKAFISFCLVSSGVYFFNDLVDIEKDKLHPVKKIRPIVAGKIGIRTAEVSSFILVIASLFLAYTTSIKLFLIVACYLLIQFLYCIKLKKIPIIDILLISSGFLLRAFAGGLLSDFISPWFILTISLGALFIAVEKRKAEIYFLNKARLTRNVLSQYSLSFLNKISNLSSTSTFLSYSLWAAGPELNGAKTSWMLLSVPFVVYGIFRYYFISDIYFSKNNELLTPEQPENIILSDKNTLINLFAWLFVVTIITAKH